MNIYGKKIVITTSLEMLFWPAKKNKLGHIILVPMRSTRWGMFAPCLICLIGILIMIFVDEYSSPEEKESFILSFAIAGVITGMLGYILSRFKTIADAHTITTYNWYGKPSTIHFLDISSVTYKPAFLFNGRFVLQGNGKTVRIPVAMIGTAQFVELLSKHVGQETCAKASSIISLRRQELTNLTRGVYRKPY